MDLSWPRHFFFKTFTTLVMTYRMSVSTSTFKPNETRDLTGCEKHHRAQCILVKWMAKLVHSSFLQPNCCSNLQMRQLPWLEFRIKILIREQRKSTVLFENRTYSVSLIQTHKHPWSVSPWLGVPAGEKSTFEIFWEKMGFSKGSLKC
jgi:hypothetical protein